jgi:hypothetical protein
MNNEQAISILITAVKIAQAKGAYTLEDSATILGAIKKLSPEPVKPEVVETAPEVETIDKE